MKNMEVEITKEEASASLVTVRRGGLKEVYNPY
jgi:hypothetical protein